MFVCGSRHVSTRVPAQWEINSAVSLSVFIARELRTDPSPTEHLASVPVSSKPHRKAALPAAQLHHPNYYMYIYILPFIEFKLNFIPYKGSTGHTAGSFDVYSLTYVVHLKSTLNYLRCRCGIPLSGHGVRFCSHFGHPRVMSDTFINCCRKRYPRLQSTSQRVDLKFLSVQVTM